MNEFDFFEVPENIKKLKGRVPVPGSIEKLAFALHSAVKSRSAGLKRCGVLFSGGLDSSIIAFVLKSLIEDTRLYCVGLDNAGVWARAEENAELLGLPLKKVVISVEEIPALVEETSNAINSTDVLQLQIASPAFAALKKAKLLGEKNVFSGTGADELFCGYAEFGKLLKEKGFDGAHELCWSKLEGMFERNLAREKSMAKHFSLNSFDPFLDESFVLEAMAFPANEKIFLPNDPLRKHVLRELARYIGLPEVICCEKKKAIQYDSGIAKHVRKISKYSRT